jgi:hypothetical protein
MLAISEVNPKISKISVFQNIGNGVDLERFRAARLLAIFDPAAFQNELRLLCSLPVSDGLFNIIAGGS